MTGLQLGAILTAAGVFATALSPSMTAADPATDDRRQPVTLPPVEALTIDSDFRVFMAPEVPAEIHRQGLRRLWRLLGWENDGLGNYEADYSGRAAVAEDAAEASRVARR